jgi:hypothetical protein
MSESRRVTSTARSIKRFWTFRLIRLFIWLDILLIALAAVGFAHFHERAALGDKWEFGLEREYNLAEAGDLLSRVRFSKYAFAVPQGERFEVAVQPFYDAALPLARIFLIAEALSVLGQMFFGGRRARRLLRPLNEMARATRALLEKQQAYESAQPAVDDEKLHELEDRIKSMRPEEKLPRVRIVDVAGRP